LKMVERGYHIRFHAFASSQTRGENAKMCILMHIAPLMLAFQSPDASAIYSIRQRVYRWLLYGSIDTRRTEES
jgi:hypothetical protein